MNWAGGRFSTIGNRDTRSKAPPNSHCSLISNLGRHKLPLAPRYPWGSKLPASISPQQWMSGPDCARVCAFLCRKNKLGSVHLAPAATSQNVRRNCLNRSGPGSLPSRLRQFQKHPRPWLPGIRNCLQQQDLVLRATPTMCRFEELPTCGFQCSAHCSLMRFEPRFRNRTRDRGTRSYRQHSRS